MKIFAPEGSYVRAWVKGLMHPVYVNGRKGKNGLYLYRVISRLQAEKGDKGSLWLKADLISFSNP